MYVDPIKQDPSKMTLSERVEALYEESQCGSWYLDMKPWQRKELSREELYQYAEELFKVIHNLNDFLMEWTLYRCDYDTIDKIQEFLKTSTDKFPTDTEYDEGYKEGYKAAKELIADIMKGA